jgi:hypothetical protein
MKARMRLTVEADLEIPDTGSTPGQRLEDVRRCIENLRHSTLPEVLETALFESQSTVVERITAVKGEVWNDNAMQAARRIACKAGGRSAAFSTLTESEVQRLAAVLGGDVWDSGGGVELIVIEKPDGRVVAVSDESVCEYADRDALESGQPSNSITLV